MDRKVFKKELDGGHYASKINKRQYKATIKLMREAHAYLKEIRGDFDLMKSSEELSELNVEVVACQLGKPDIIGLIEEMADVQICMSVIQDMYGIKNDTLNQAINIKMARNQARALDILRSAKHFVPSEEKEKDKKKTDKKKS